MFYDFQIRNFGDAKRPGIRMCETLGRKESRCQSKGTHVCYMGFVVVVLVFGGQVSRMH